MGLVAKEFAKLTTEELYEILKARAEIFIMEQQILYQDLDDIDYRSIHFFYKEEGKVTAYLRAFYQDDGKTCVKIGRVLTLTHGKGLGKQLFRESLEEIVKTMPCQKICMDAQKYAVGFYERFGFTVVSEEFLEEGIMHVAMERNIGGNRAVRHKI